ncbi:MAG: DUF5996 family protein [Longimicrobiales bacterium]
MRATNQHRSTARREPWPALPLEDWRDTCETLHMWTQIVGKTRLSLAPMVNHWWQVPLYVSARGLTTSRIPHDEHGFEIEFDLVGHELTIAADDGARWSMKLEPRSVANFYDEYMAGLHGLGLDVRIWPHPVEVQEPIPFPEDETHQSYDAAAANRFWRALAQADRVLHEFRGRFIGKCSPVHFFWGGFDLACTRFSGRPAPVHPGGIPNLGDWVTRESYSHECISAGWWPGTAGGPVPEPAFYAYAYPEPAGFPEAPIRPASGKYDMTLREWVLPYDAARMSADPDTAVLDFLQSTYDAAANLGGWGRQTLERTR